MKIYIYELRTSLNISLTQLSIKSGIARSYIQRIEAGNANPSLEVMCKLANALNVNVHDLFDCS